jgi:hypothetical protein
VRKLRIIADRKCDKFDIPRPVNDTIIDPTPKMDITNTIEKLRSDKEVLYETS